jgi:C4-dicarboxylate-specific signal transduction histidine kinase
MDDLLLINSAPAPATISLGDILIVDDSEDSLELLVDTLSQAGYTLRTATTGPLALAAVAESPPEVILLDINMPEMDGYEVCQQLKAVEQSHDIPIIFISAMGETLDKVQAFASGGADYISKPFELAEVVLRVENQLNQQRLRTALRQANEVLEQRVVERTDALSKTIIRLEEQIYERMRTEAALQQYTDRLSVLHQIDREILVAQSPEVIVQAALKHLPDLVPCQWAGVSLFDYAGAESTLLASTPAPAGLAGPRLPARLPLADFGQIEDLQQGQLLVEDLASLTPLSALDKHLMAANLQSRIHAPLISRDELIGCLTISATRPGIYSVEHSAIAEEVATQLALALDNARLHRETQHQARELTALNKASRAMASTLDLNTVLEQTMAEVRTLLQAEGASILLHDPALDELYFAIVVAPGAEVLTGLRVPLTQGIAGWVMAEKQSVLSDDVQHDPRFYDRVDSITGVKTHSLLAVPLIYKDKAIGLVEVVNKIGEKFKAQDLKMLEALTSSAVIAIENARLYQDQQERVQLIQEAQQRLIHSEKMAALGRLAASITHEINNPLQSVQTCLTLTREELEGEQRRHKLDRYLDIVEAEIERVSGITLRMSDFYRPTANQGLQQLQLPEIIESVLELTGKQLQTSQIVVESYWPNHLPKVQANSDHLKQVFLNLVLNAIDAMPEGGTLRIKIGRGRTAPNHHLPAVPAVRVEFSDTGVGMSSETLSNLFEPFFTTKPYGSGLGLGISYNIIEAHNGQISVTSQLGAGTTFHIVLPLKQPPTQLGWPTPGKETV